MAYFVAKEEIPLTKYPQILSLEQRHGVSISNAYQNNKSCGVFINYIGKTLSTTLHRKLREANFCSVLTDGSSDVSIKEKEAVFVLYLEPLPPGKDTIEIVTSFLKFLTTLKKPGMESNKSLRSRIKFLIQSQVCI